MGTIGLDKVVYQLTVADLQNVAQDILKRKLTESEIKLLEERVGNHLDWYEAIYNAINSNIKNDSIN